MSRFESVKDYIEKDFIKHNLAVNEFEVAVAMYLIEREWLREHKGTFTDANFMTDGNNITISPASSISEPAGYDELEDVAHDVLTRYHWGHLDEMINDFHNDEIIKKYISNHMTQISYADLIYAGEVFESYCFVNQKQFTVEEVASAILAVSKKELCVEQVNILLYLCQCEAVYRSGSLLFLEYIALEDDMLNFVKFLPAATMKLNDYAKNIVYSVLKQYSELSLEEIKHLVCHQPAWRLHKDTKFRNWIAVVRDIYLDQARFRRIEESTIAGLRNYMRNNTVYDMHILENCIFDVLITPRYALDYRCLALDIHFPEAFNGIVIFDNLLAWANTNTLSRFTIFKVQNGAIQKETIWEASNLPDIVMKIAAEYYSRLDSTAGILFPVVYDTAVTRWISAENA